MTTTETKPDRAAIDLRNAQKSTGPRTPEGKSRSRFNAVKHGMTAKTLVLPDEDADVLQMRVETWIADLQPQNDVEQYLGEQAVHLSWKLDRAERVEVARLSQIIESAPAVEANRQQHVVFALGQWLFSHKDWMGDATLQNELLNILAPEPASPTNSFSLERLNHPAAIVSQLESTEPGCHWLRDRWTELRAQLDQGAAWSWEQKVQALRLLGTRPLEKTASQWDSHILTREYFGDAKTDILLNQLLDRQLDYQVAARNSRRPAGSGAWRTRRWRGWRRC